MVHLASGPSPASLRGTQPCPLLPYHIIKLQENNAILYAVTNLRHRGITAKEHITVGSNSYENRSDKRAIETAEMRFLRPMAGYTFLDKKKKM